LILKIQTTKSYRYLSRCKRDPRNRSTKFIRSRPGTTEQLDARRKNPSVTRGPRTCVLVLGSRFPRVSIHYCSAVNSTSLDACSLRKPTRRSKYLPIEVESQLGTFPAKNPVKLYDIVRRHAEQ